jgi:predicted metal-dependent phosphoesterase TrpH
MTPVQTPRLVRVDLHVHSFHSGFTTSMRMFRSRDCYSDPEAVYRAARARGMDVVTITDHDSIDGCLQLLDHHPGATDILMGEEIECRVPGIGVRVHLGAFGLTERHHREVQPLRANVIEAAAFLRSEGVALVLHHPFHFFRGEAAVGDYLEPLLSLVHAVEVRNGTMAAAHNDLAADIAAAWNRRRPRARLGETGGSDAHVVGHVGTSFTEAPGRTREEFLEGLKRGESRGAGLHGTYGRLAFEIYGVICQYWGSLVGLRPSGLTAGQRAQGIVGSVLSLPFQFSPLIVTAVQKRGERRRVARWRREWQSRQSPREGGAFTQPGVI